MEDTLFRGNREPSLDQILAEPIVQTMMRRDGVEPETVRRLMRQAAQAARPPDRAKLRFMPPAPPTQGIDSRAPQASIGMLTQAAGAPRWPRVFPSL